MWSDGATKNLNLEDIKICTVTDEIAKGNIAQAFTEKGEYIPVTFIAPIDLKIADLCMVDTSDGYLFQIDRRNMTIWQDMVDGA